jgi:N-methylhydantoinase A
VRSAKTGSIASVDSLGQIRIGPHSAGSEPGPASYGRGGEDATVTDANVQLGRLHPDTFGATDIDLSPTLAGEALVRSVGERLGLSAADAARGVAEVVDENMTNAARVHAVENGKDLAGYSMIAFGGGGPLHASRLLDKLGLDELIVPPDAGVGSAVGFLRAPFAYEAVRSFYTSTVDFDVEGANQVLAELADEAMAFVREGTDADVTVERQVAMRYKGQGWEIPVRLSDTGSNSHVFDDMAAELLGAEFTKAYEEFFGRAIDDLAIEAVSWSVRVASVVDATEPVELEFGDGAAAAEIGRRSMYDPVTAEDAEALVVERGSLAASAVVDGPAVIVEEQTTTVLASHHRAVMQTDGTLLVRRRHP